MPFIAGCCSNILANASPMQHSCSHYNAFCSATWHTCMYLSTWQQKMTTITQPLQCDLQPQIPKHLITTHTRTLSKQLEATVTLRPKNHIASCSQFTRKKCGVSRSGFLPTASPRQHSVAIPTRFAVPPFHPKSPLLMSQSHHFSKSPLP